jgi:RNA 3'-terminal phosphate cyclase (ATP)
VNDLSTLSSLSFCFFLYFFLLKKVTPALESAERKLFVLNTMPQHSSKHKSNHPRDNQRRKQDPYNNSKLDASILSDPFLIHLDGRTLEGGGQLVRVALTLSSLTRVPIHIHSIRGNRTGGGGLKSSHLAALKFLAEATKAKTQGAFIGSTEILFAPGKDKSRILKGTDKAGSNGDEHEGETYEIRQQKPGSVFLILQAILPHILFTSSSPSPFPTRLIMTGGTNVPKSMSAEYVEQVMVPTFEKIGLPRIEVDIRKRGWTNGSSIEISEVEVIIHPFLTEGEKIRDADRTAPGPNPDPPSFPPFGSLLERRGPITQFAISVLAATATMRSSLIEQTKSLLLLLQEHHNPEPAAPTPTKVVLSEPSTDPKRIYLLLVAHTSTGHRLGRDWLYDRKITPSKRKGPKSSQTRNANHRGAPISDQPTEPEQDPDQELHLSKTISERVVTELMTEIAHGGGVDEYMQDQVVVFEAIAARADCGRIENKVRQEEEEGGGGEGDEGEEEESVKKGESLHTKTSRWVTRQFLFDK